MGGHVFKHIQDFISGLIRPRLLPTGVAVSAPPSTDTQIQWADNTYLSWGDGTPVEWSNA